MGVWIEHVATVESFARSSRSDGSRSPSSLLYDHGGCLCSDLAVCGNSDRSQNYCGMAGRSILAYRVASRRHRDAAVRSAAKETSLSRRNSSNLDDSAPRTVHPAFRSRPTPLAHSFVIVSSRFRRTLETTVHAASCTGVEPFGTFGVSVESKPAKSQGLAHPSAKRCLCFCSRPKSSADSRGVGVRATQRRKA